MPPKPRGLAASRKRAAVEPSAPAPAAEEVVRTFPLDEDALTLSDLFELRQTITNLLLTPGSDGEAERQEEARGLIRGILHAAQGLQASLPTAASTSTLAPDAEAHLDALGLLSPLAPSKLAFLQAFALHEMSSILPPPLSAVDVSSVATGSDGPSKKRKVDPSEPTSAGEWLELAAIKYEKARESLPGPGAWATMIAIESTRVFMERAVISLLSDRTGEEGKSLVEQTIQKFLATCGLLETAPVPDTDDEDAPDVPAALLRLLAIYIPFIDDFAEPPHFTLMTNIAVLGLVTTCLDSPVLAGEATPLRQIDIAIINADLRMTIFSQCEVAVTDKYRQVVEEEEEAEDDEAVVPLPDSEDVRQARAAGKTAIAALEESIKLFDAVPVAERSKSLQRSQYLKLQEAFLTFEVLLDEKDEEELEWCTAGGERVEAMLAASS